MIETDPQFVIQTERIPIQSNVANECGRINLHLVQNSLLIWLDNTIDENNSDWRNNISKIRGVVNSVNTFIDGEECIDFLGDIEGEKACMIISGTFGRQIVPLIHNMPQVAAIFIFCGNKHYHEQWTKHWSKIEGVFTEIQPIYEALKDTSQQCEQNAISMSVINTDDDLTKKKLDQLDPSFMYTQIMKEILLTIRFEPKHIQEFIQYCREALSGNKKQLEKVNQLEREYHKQTPIWWYTYECFLYSMLNRALRTVDIDLIIKLGFFTGDLHRQIEQLHQAQLGNNDSTKHVILYRGQGMENQVFEKITQTKGGLLSFNCFLSTTKNRDLSLKFARRALSNAGMMGVLFVMTIDPGQSSTPFTSVDDVGYFGAKENEVLFSMHTVFRIGEITFMDSKSQLAQVQLTLTSEKDTDLCRVTDRIREETFPQCSGWYRLTLILMKMGHTAKTEQLYDMLLKEEANDSDKAPLYCQLGTMKTSQGKYEEAIAYYEKFMRIEESRVPRDDQTLASSYNNIGLVYSNMSDYSKALSSYEKALAIRQQSLPPTHPDLVPSYNNIGLVYSNMSDYSKALSSHEKALAIQQQSLSPTHPDLASSYNNIGNVYSYMGDYSKALSSYEKALAIQQQSLPPTHPDLASSYNNIGNVYFYMGDYSKALSSHEKALAIRQQSLSPTHPDLASSYNNIGLLYSNMSDYSKALSSYEKSLAILQQSLPPTHPALASSYNNIGSVYSHMGDYSKALSFVQYAVDIAQSSMQATHPNMQTYLRNLANLKMKL